MISPIQRVPGTPANILETAVTQFGVGLARCLGLSWRCTPRARKCGTTFKFSGDYEFQFSHHLLPRQGDLANPAGAN
jgi:hypothetical protein